MEGNLLKWTNYWMGWQLRWFVLKDGVLSYYNNQNESKSGGCKRSFKIFLFDIIGQFSLFKINDCFIFVIYIHFLVLKSIKVIIQELI